MSGWPRVRLRHVCEINPPIPEFSAIPSDQAVTFLPLETIWPDAVDTSRERPKRELESGYTRFRDGDVLVPKITPTFEASRSVVARGLRGGVGAGTTELHVLRPRPQLDTRFLFYITHSAPFLEEGTGSMQGVAGQKRVPESVVADFRIDLPPVQDQRRIADFLDRETARIDALMDKKQRMIERIEERIKSIADSVIWAGVSAEIPLMFAIDQHRPVMYGIVLPGPDVEEGVPIVKGGDVSMHRLTREQLCRTTPEIEAPFARARLRAGDVLFAIRGGVGDAALVPPELEGANITQDVARVAPAAHFRPDWLVEVMQTYIVQRRAAALITGATIKGLNIRDLERIRIPSSDRERQEADLRVLRPLRSRNERLSGALERQIQLLTEHRKALITAAVTGQVQVPNQAA